MKSLTERQSALIKLCLTPPRHAGIELDWVALAEPGLGVTTALHEASNRHRALIHAPAFTAAQAARLMCEQLGVTGSGIAARLWRIVEALRRSRADHCLGLVLDEAEKLPWLSLETLCYTAEWCARAQHSRLRMIFLFHRKPVWNNKRQLYEPRFAGAFSEPGAPQCAAFRRLRRKATCWELSISGLRRIKTPKAFILQGEGSQKARTAVA